MTQDEFNEIMDIRSPFDNTNCQCYCDDCEPSLHGRPNGVAGHCGRSACMGDETAENYR